MVLVSILKFMFFIVVLAEKPVQQVKSAQKVNVFPPAPKSCPMFVMAVASTLKNIPNIVVAVAQLA